MTDTTITAIRTTMLRVPCPQPPWLPTDTGLNDATQLIFHSTQQANEPPPPVI